MSVSSVNKVLPFLLGAVGTAGLNKLNTKDSQNAIGENLNPVGLPAKVTQQKIQQYSNTLPITSMCINGLIGGIGATITSGVSGIFGKLVTSAITGITAEWFTKTIVQKGIHQRRNLIDPETRHESLIDYQSIKPDPPKFLTVLPNILQTPATATALMTFAIGALSWALPS